MSPRRARGDLGVNARGTPKSGTGKDKKWD